MCGEAYDFATSFPRKAPKLEMARQLISKLAIKGEKCRTDEEETQYKKFVNTVSSRISSLVNKVGKHHAFERNDISRTDIFIDIGTDICSCHVWRISVKLSEWVGEWGADLFIRSNNPNLTGDEQFRTSKTKQKEL